MAKFIVGTMVGHPPEPEDTPSDMFVLSRCRVGLEYEFENPENVRIPRVELGDDLYAHYSPHNDGSLRDGGVEFVFSRPLLGQPLLNALEAMESFIRRVPLVGTYRTSVHVHLDVRNMEFEELKTLAFLYALNEKYFYNFANQFTTAKKELSNYCIPWGSSDSYTFAVAEALFGQKAPALLGVRSRKMERYSGLNFNAIHKFGSIEFRHLPTITNVSALVQFINMAMSLKKAAKAQTLEHWTGLAWQSKEVVRDAVFGPVANGLPLLSDEDFGSCHETATLIQSVVDVSKFKWTQHNEFVGDNPYYPKEDM